MVPESTHGTRPDTRLFLAKASVGSDGAVLIREVIRVYSYIHVCTGVYEVMHCMQSWQYWVVYMYMCILKMCKRYQNCAAW